MTIRIAKFQIGDIVRHRVYTFRGVIFDVDPEFANTEEWWQSIPEDARPRKDQPFYHLLAVRRAHSRPVRGENQHPSVGHSPERARSALRLQVPYTLPTQDRPHMRARAPPVVRDNRGTPNLLSHRHRRTASCGAGFRTCVSSSRKLRIDVSNQAGTPNLGGCR